jgi:hypothetical protein
MSAPATRTEREAGRRLTPAEIFKISAARETSLSRLLILYICTGLAFMLLPGTFLGVWNRITISTRRSAQTVSPAWIQAHRHAQIVGWIGTFILGGLLNSQAPTPECLWLVRRVRSLGIVDGWSLCSLALHRLLLALASPLTDVSRG